MFSEQKKKKTNKGKKGGGGRGWEGGWRVEKGTAILSGGPSHAKHGRRTWFEIAVHKHHFVERAKGEHNLCRVEPRLRRQIRFGHEDEKGEGGGRVNRTNCLKNILQPRALPFTDPTPNRFHHHHHTRTHTRAHTRKDGVPGQRCTCRPC